MISINSYHLDKNEKKLIKEYCEFVLNKFVKKTILNKAVIKVEIVHEDDLEYYDADDLRALDAWCQYAGVHKDKKVFRVVLNVKHITKSKNPLLKFKKILINLGHELIHIKQYLNGEMFDYVSGGVRYKGSYFDRDFQMSLEAYFDAPWEIEAYGRELGLYKMFKVLNGEYRLK